MHKSLLAAAPALLLASTAAMAGNYQFDTEGGYVRLDPDFGPKVDTWLAGLEYHFAPVDVGSSPLAEAAFLARSSNIGAAVGRTEVGSSKVNMLGAGVEFYVPNTIFYGAGQVVRVSNGSSDTTWAVEGGVTPIDGMLLTLGYADGDESWALSGKYVMPLNGVTAVNLEASTSFADDFNTYSVGGDYYFNRRISLGASYDYLDFDGGGSDSAFTVRGRAFFNDTISASAFWTFADDDKAYGLSLSARF